MTCLSVIWAVRWPGCWTFLPGIPAVRPGMTPIASFATEAEARQALALLAMPAAGHA